MNPNRPCRAEAGPSPRTARRRSAVGLLGIIAGILLLLNAAAPDAGAGPVPTVTQLKAVFLFNFVRFTDWRAGTPPTTTEPLVIGVIGTDPFGPVLDAVVEGEKINDRPLVVRRLTSTDDPTGCQVLFISRSEEARVSGLLSTLRTKPILTVSDVPGFCQRGGMVNLVLTPAGTIKPEVNPQAAVLCGVAISSRILSLPSIRIVRTDP